MVHGSWCLTCTHPNHNKSEETDFTLLKNYKTNLTAIRAIVTFISKTISNPEDLVYTSFTACYQLYFAFLVSFHLDPKNT